VGGYDFVGYDDPDTVLENPVVIHGLSGQGLRQAFLGTHVGFWLPVTFLSLALDHELYGMNPGGFHVTNVILHAACAVLCFWALYLLTGSFWPALAAALLFAAHPLRVESVAWITERKDVLSGLFWFLALLAYSRYVRTRKPLDYLTVAVCFALGLMAKPMVITLPFVLLILDYWPLGRYGGHADPAGREPFLRLVLEKAPLFALCAGAAWITLWAQVQSGALTSVSVLGVSDRLSNSLYAYSMSLWKFFWPTALAVVYPHPGYSLTSAPILAGALVLSAITAAVVLARKRAPWLLVGWLFYLGVLFPVSGVAQSGVQAYADRFTYLPHTGLALMAAWAGAQFAGRLSVRRGIAVGLLALCVTGLAGVSAAQVRYWKNSLTLFSHTLAVTRENWLTENLLGAALFEEGRYREAEEHLRRSVAIHPGFAHSRVNLANALAHMGMEEEAFQEYERALALNPDLPDAENGMGILSAEKGDYGEAARRYRKALKARPNFSAAHNNLATLLVQTGDIEGAVRHYQKALELNPSLASAHYNLGLVFKSQGRYKEAFPHFLRAVEVRPGYALALNAAGTLLAEAGQTGPAIDYLRRAVAADPESFDAQFNLGIFLMKEGGQEEALPHLEKAASLAPGNPVAWSAWGSALLLLERKEEAAERFRQALDLDPEFSQAREGLSQALEGS